MQHDTENEEITMCNSLTLTELSNIHMHKSNGAGGNVYKYGRQYSPLPSVAHIVYVAISIY